MKSIEETKKHFNVLIKNDKKHLKFFDQEYKEYKNSKNLNGSMYFLIEDRAYEVKNYKEIKFNLERSQKNSKDEKEEKPSFDTYFIRVLNAFIDFEDNDCSSWILENYEYLKNRVLGIYNNNKTCHLYQFKYVQNIPENKNNSFINL